MGVTLCYLFMLDRLLLHLGGELELLEWAALFRDCLFLLLLELVEHVALLLLLLHLCLVVDLRSEVELSEVTLLHLLCHLLLLHL